MIEWTWFNYHLLAHRAPRTINNRFQICIGGFARWWYWREWIGVRVSAVLAIDDDINIDIDDDDINIDIDINIDDDIGESGLVFV